MNASVLRDACPPSPRAHERRIASWLHNVNVACALADARSPHEWPPAAPQRLSQLSPAPPAAVTLTPPRTEAKTESRTPTRQRPTLGLLAAVAEQRRRGQPHIRTLIAAGFDERTLNEELFEPLGLQRLGTLARLAESLEADNRSPKAVLLAYRQQGRNLSCLFRLVSTLSILGFSEKQRCRLLRHYEVARACAEHGHQLKERAGVRWREQTLEMLALAEHRDFVHRLPEYLRGIARGACTAADFERVLSKPVRVRA